MAQTVAQVALWTLLPYGLGLAASLHEYSWAFLKLYPFRVGSCLFLLLGAMLTIPVLLRGLLSPAGRNLLLIAVAWLTFSDAWDDFLDGVGDLLKFPMGAKVSSTARTKRFHGACAWIRESTPRDALLLAPVVEETISYLTERPVVVMFRQVPSAPADIHEWYHRLVAFNRGRRPRGVAYPAGSEVEFNFESMTPLEYIALARKFGASYLLLPNRRKLSLPLLYKNASWAVYDLDDHQGGQTQEAAPKD